MPRKLTATTGVLLALVFAGCGKDNKSDSTAQSAANATTPAAAATTTTATSSGSKKQGKTSSKTPTATTDALPSSSSSSSSSKKKTSGSKSSSKTKTTSKATKKKSTTPKATTTKSPVPAVTPKSSGSDLTSGTGSGPIADREDVVAVLRRYYTAFIAHDGGTVCSLLTSAGQKLMIDDGNGKNCEESVKKLISSASAENMTLLQRTRDGLHADDITVNGNNATAQIGKTSTLRLVQQDGRWLVRSPNVVVSKS